MNGRMPLPKPWATTGVRCRQGGGGGFSCDIRIAAASNCSILRLEGAGKIHLQRHQVGCGILWLPVVGTSFERVNGIEAVVAPGEALLIRPGDWLCGETDVETEGYSIMLPEKLFRLTTPKGSWAYGRPLVVQPATQVQLDLLRIAQGLCAATRAGDPGRHQLALDLQDKIRQFLLLSDQRGKPIGMPRKKRLEIIEYAEAYMNAHLTEPCSIQDLANALEIPLRSLQRAFSTHVGRSPLEQFQLLRMDALRRQLSENQNASLSIADHMHSVGLAATGYTAASYRSLFGELPVTTFSRTKN